MRGAEEREETGGQSDTRERDRNRTDAREERDVESCCRNFKGKTCVKPRDAIYQLYYILDD